MALSPAETDCVLIDLEIEVPPYPRVTVHLPRHRGQPAWASDADALRRLTAFYDHFGWLLKAARVRPLDFPGPYSVTLRIWKKSKAGDLDNLLKSVFDALTKNRIWRDDSDVKECHVYDIARAVRHSRLTIEIRRA